MCTCSDEPSYFVIRDLPELLFRLLDLSELTEQERTDYLSLFDLAYQHSVITTHDLLRETQKEQTIASAIFLSRVNPDKTPFGKKIPPKALIRFESVLFLRRAPYEDEPILCFVPGLQTNCQKIQKENGWCAIRIFNKNHHYAEMEIRNHLITNDIPF